MVQGTRQYHHKIYPIVMDLFGSDSDSDDSEGRSPSIDEQRAIFSILCERKLFLKELAATSSPSPKGKICKKILIVCADAETPVELTQKLQALQPPPVFTLSCELDEKYEGKTHSYDIIVDLTATNGKISVLEDSAKFVYKSLVPGGLYIYLGTGNLDIGIEHSWCRLHGRVDVVTRKDTTISILRKALVLCNSTGAVYWASDNVYNEECLLASITVPLSIEERKRCMLSIESHHLAMDSLKKNGICIIRGMFDCKYIEYLGGQSLKDLEMAIRVLKDQKGIDLERPGEEGQPMINNFYELSMREALRCDLRNGPNMKQAFLDSKDDHDPNHFNLDLLQYNPYILSMLKEVMYEVGPDESGNWGRWNFEGNGPDLGPPDIKAGQIGTIISMPGCSDQTIHADTSHIFVHTQLPPHYINAFMIATDTMSDEIDLSVGQTAFLVGSQQLNVSKSIMVDQNIDDLTQRLVRPHLSPGDVLFFDCRILHFGLANQSNTGNFPSKLSHKNLFNRSKRLGEMRMKVKEPICNVSNLVECIDALKLKKSCVTTSTINSNSPSAYLDDINITLTDEVLATSIPKPQKRAILYVNYTHTWFHDPKNWNEAERLFSS